MKVSCLFVLRLFPLRSMLEKVLKKIPLTFLNDIVFNIAMYICFIKFIYHPPYAKTMNVNFI